MHTTCIATNDSLSSLTMLGVGHNQPPIHKDDRCLNSLDTVHAGHRQLVGQGLAGDSVAAQLLHRSAIFNAELHPVGCDAVGIWHCTHNRKIIIPFIAFSGLRSRSLSPL